MSSKLPIVWLFFWLHILFWAFYLHYSALCNLFAVATRQSAPPAQHSPPTPATANRISTINIYHVTTQISHTVECVAMDVFVCVLSQVHFSFYWCGMLATHLPHSAATSRANKCACIAKAFCTRKPATNASCCERFQFVFSVCMLSAKWRRARRKAASSLTKFRMHRNA